MLLLDTQLLLWCAFSPEKLKPSARRLVSERTQSALQKPQNPHKA